MTNVEIRRAAGAAGVKLWQIAEQMGLSDSSFSRKLRKELSREQKADIIFIIKQLEKQRGN